MSDGAPKRRLAVLVDGAPMPDAEALAFWDRFSLWMEEHRGDLAGFAAREGFASVHPGVDGDRPVLRASKQAAQRPYASVKEGEITRQAAAVDPALARALLANRIGDGAIPPKTRGKSVSKVGHGPTMCGPGACYSSPSTWHQPASTSPTPPIRLPARSCWTPRVSADESSWRPKASDARDRGPLPSASERNTSPHSMEAPPAASSKCRASEPPCSSRAWTSADASRSSAPES